MHLSIVPSVVPKISVKTVFGEKLSIIAFAKEEEIPVAAERGASQAYSSEKFRAKLRVDARKITY